VPSTAAQADFQTVAGSGRAPSGRSSASAAVHKRRRPFSGTNCLIICSQCSCRIPGSVVRPRYFRWPASCTPSLSTRRRWSRASSLDAYRSFVDFHRCAGLLIGSFYDLAPLYGTRRRLFTEQVACHEKWHSSWHAGAVAACCQAAESVRPGLVDRARQDAVGAGRAAAGRTARAATVAAEASRSIEMTGGQWAAATGLPIRQAQSRGRSNLLARHPPARQPISATVPVAPGAGARAGS